MSVGFSAQVLGYGHELLQRTLQIFDDAGGDFSRRQKIVCAFETFVAQPEEIQAELVAFEEFFVAEWAKPLALLALLKMAGTIRGHKVIKMAAGERIGAQGEIHIGAQVVDPEPLGLCLRILVEEENIGLDSLSVEDTRRQAQHGVYIAVLQQIGPNSLASPPSKSTLSGTITAARPPLPVLWSRL